MYTQCPHCDAIFQVTTAQLKAANGEVRCGQCLTVFNALNHLSDDIPTSVSKTQASTHGTGNDSPTATPATPTKNAVAEAPVDSIESVIANNDAPISEPRPEPEPAAAVSSVETAGEAPVTSPIEKTTEATDADIFNEVIAQASQHNLPSEEIDRFEEFLSTDSSAAVDVDETYSAGPSEQTSEFEAANIAHDNESSSAELSEAEWGSNQFDAVKLDEPASSTDESDIEIGATTNTETKLNFDTENEAIIIEESDLEPMTSEAYTDQLEISREAEHETTTAHTHEVKNEEVNAAEPINKAAEKFTELDDFSDLEEAAAEVSTTTEPMPSETGVHSNSGKTRPPGSSENLEIPHLIMEDLHAAKAEQLRPSNIPWVIGCLVLMLTLVLQVVYHSRNELAKDANLRPWLIQMCQLVDCTLTQPYDIKQIDIIGREVRTHPTARKALIASTTLINNASFVQPFPLLTVEFSDINGKQLAARRFTPREYLSKHIDLAAGMTPDLPVRIELELVDPGKAAVNYEFHAELDPRNTRPLT